MIEITRPLPPLAFIPLFIIWFGIGETPKFMLILVGVVPIMIIATVSALDAVPKELVQAGRSLGGSPLWTLLTVRLRARSGDHHRHAPGDGRGVDQHRRGRADRGTSGLGYLINNAGVNLQTPLVLSGILAISILGLVSTACSGCSTASPTRPPAENRAPLRALGRGGRRAVRSSTGPRRRTHSGRCRARVGHVRGVAPSGGSTSSPAGGRSRRVSSGSDTSQPGQPSTGTLSQRASSVC